MATITFTESLIGRVYPGDLDESYNVILLSSGITAGHALRQDPTTGAYALTSATASGTAGFRGIALETNVASGVVSILRRGVLYGYDLVAAGTAYDAPVYLGNAAGTLDTAPGAVSVLVGRVVSVTDPGRTQVLYIDSEYASDGDLG